MYICLLKQAVVLHRVFSTFKAKYLKIYIFRLFLLHECCMLLLEWSKVKILITVLPTNSDAIASLVPEFFPQVDFSD